MKYSQARQGRTFVVRLEDGEVIHEQIEELAAAESVAAATVIALGGADRGSILVVGPEDGRSQPVQPMERTLDGVHEVVGTGTVFPDADGRPTLHLHLAAGREGRTVTGCVRRGVRTWQVLEVVLTELVETTARRVPDPTLGFALLQP